MYLRHTRKLKSNNQRNAKSMFIPFGGKVLWRKINLASMLRRTIVVLNPAQITDISISPTLYPGDEICFPTGRSVFAIVCAHGICRRGVSQFPRCRAWHICSTKGRQSNYWSCKWTCPRIWVDRPGCRGSAKGWYGRRLRSGGGHKGKSLILHR